jgi:hypothetical protein
MGTDQSDEFDDDSNVKGLQEWGQVMKVTGPVFVIVNDGVGGFVTVRIAGSLTAIPKALLTTTVNLVPSPYRIFVKIRLAFVVFVVPMN